jgi:hypothetical protein
VVVEEEPETLDFVKFRGTITVGVASGTAVDKPGMSDGEQGALASDNILQATVERDRLQFRNDLK